MPHFKVTIHAEQTIFLVKEKVLEADTLDEARKLAEERVHGDDMDDFEDWWDEWDYDNYLVGDGGDAAVQDVVELTFGEDGYDTEGFNRDGYDREGYDREGYNEDGDLRPEA